jgi:diadenylate cyclase
MELFNIGFVSVRLVDIIDISVVAFLFYKLYDILKGSMAMRVMGVIFSIFLVWKLVDLLDFRLLKSILDEFLGLGAIAVVIIFAPEIRRFLTAISKNTIFDRILRQVSARTDSDLTYREVLESVKDLRLTGNGALIVLTGADSLNEIQDTGDRIDALISARLISSIFQKQSPLHDGAMILVNNKISSVRCILPISQNPDIPPQLGMRHRAGIGISEISDAMTIILSEETREVSLSFRGELRRNVDQTDLEQAVKNHLQHIFT